MGIEIRCDNDENATTDEYLQVTIELYRDGKKVQVADIEQPHFFEDQDCLAAWVKDELPGLLPE